MCVMVCPFGGVSADPVAKKAHKCDRCPERTEAGLDPACVAACPTKAMIFATPEEVAELRRQTAALAAVGQAKTNVASSVAAWRSLRGEA
jgi:carbon-monoxide dehydrogenase iron sulfur subunit